MWLDGNDIATRGPTRKDGAAPGITIEKATFAGQRS